MVFPLNMDFFASCSMNLSSWDIYLYTLYSKSCWTSSDLGSSSSPSSLTCLGSSILHLISRRVAAITRNSLIVFIFVTDL